MKISEYYRNLGYIVTSFRIKEDIHEEFMDLLEEKGLKMTWVLEQLVSEYVNKNKKKKGKKKRS
jgi:hypothetical protein